tara:strand:- start:789 stop:971 length:183 start_codon:yes stop_codon:yes gene_type:complete
MDKIKNWFKRVGAGIAAGYVVYKNPNSAKAVDKITSVAKDKNVKKAISGLSKLGKKKRKK